MYLRRARSYFCRNYVSFHSRFVPACAMRRHHIGLYADIVNSQRTMIFRDICHVSRPYSSSHFPLHRHHRLRRCIQKRSRPELDNLNIAWHVLATSMRRFHSSFRIFSIRPALPSLSSPLSPRFSLLPADLTCCCTDASSPIYSPCRNARYYFRHSILPLSIIGSRSNRRE